MGNRYKGPRNSDCETFVKGKFNLCCYFCTLGYISLLLTSIYYSVKKTIVWINYANTLSTNAVSLSMFFTVCTRIITIRWISVVRFHCNRRETALHRNSIAPTTHKNKFVVIGWSFRILNSILVLLSHVLVVWHFHVRYRRLASNSDCCQKYGFTDYHRIQQNSNKSVSNSIYRYLFIMQLILRTK